MKKVIWVVLTVIVIGAVLMIRLAKEKSSRSSEELQDMQQHVQPQEKPHTFAPEVNSHVPPSKSIEVPAKQSDVP